MLLSLLALSCEYMSVWYSCGHHLIATSSAGIALVCDTSSVTCPSEGGLFARCTSTSSVIVWTASLDNELKSGVLDFSDPNQYNRSVTVNGIEVTFVKQGDGVSFAAIQSPNASLNGLRLSCADQDNVTTTPSCTLDNFFGEFITTSLSLLDHTL